MSLVKKFASTFLTFAVLGGFGYAGYQFRDDWWPYVFPEKSDAKPEHDHGAEPEAHDAAERVKLSPQAQANLGLDVDTLEPQAYWRTLVIPGAVVDRPGESDRSVTSRVAGVVVEILARPGDTVRAGDPLFRVQLVSEFLQGTQSELAKAARELQFSTVKRDRFAGLVKQGTMPEATLIEEENQVKRFTTQVQALRRQLQLFGLDPAQLNKAEQGDYATEMTIVAPERSIASTFWAPGSATTVYELQELKAQLGEQVAAGQTLCLLANHQRLFVEGRAFKSEATALAKAMEQKLPIKAVFPDEAAGEWPVQNPLGIHHLSNEVDPATRTFAFYLSLDNLPRTFDRDGRTYFVWRYRPGQQVRLRVPVEKLGDDVFVLPAGAVIREGAEAYVFRQNGKIFDRKSVHVLYEDRTDVVIANDGSIAAGSYVVRNQAAALNRALKSGGPEPAAHDHAGHSHDH